MEAETETFVKGIFRSVGGEVTVESLVYCYTTLCSFFPDPSLKEASLVAPSTGFLPEIHATNPERSVPDSGLRSPHEACLIFEAR